MLSRTAFSGFFYFIFINPLTYTGVDGKIYKSPKHGGRRNSSLKTEQQKRRNETKPVLK